MALFTFVHIINTALHGRVILVAIMPKFCHIVDNLPKGCLQVATQIRQVVKLSIPPKTRYLVNSLLP